MALVSIISGGVVFSYIKVITIGRAVRGTTGYGEVSDEGKLIARGR